MTMESSGLQGSAGTESTYFNVTVDDLSPNRTAHKLDKECSICSGPLSRKLGVLASKDRYWYPSHSYFCYRGVCSKCSGHKVRHPETNKDQRCCNACYTKFLSMSIQAEKTSEIQQIRAKSDVIESQLQREENERENEDRRRAQLEAEVTRLKDDLMRNECLFLSQKAALEKEIEDATQENSRLLSIVHTLESELEDAQRDFNQSEVDLKAVTFELANCNVKANELKSLLLTQQHENEVIRRNLDTKLAASPVPVTDPGAGKRQTRIEELKAAVEAASQRQMQLQQEQSELVRKTDAAEKRLKEKETQLERAQESVAEGREMRVSTAVSEPDVRKLAIATELKEKIRSLRDENERLKREIEAQTPGGDEETKGRDGPGPHRTAACPNCQVF